MKTHSPKNHPAFYSLSRSRYDTPLRNTICLLIYATLPLACGRTDLDPFTCRTEQATCVQALEQNVCPSDMVNVGSTGFCMDKYEASIVNASARSLLNVMPAVEVNWDAATAACIAAGKVLCPKGVWTAACEGPQGLSFPYGAQFEDGRCNNDKSAPTQTGSYTQCVSSDGAYDLAGNVAEWTDDCTDSEYCFARGGTAATAENNAACATNPLYEKVRTNTSLGFRCCLQR